MSGFKKRIYLYLCILLSVLCLGLFAVEHSSKKGGTVYAETAVFQMADGVAYRNCWSESHCGLTYSATLNKAYYDNFVSTNAVTHDVSVNLLVVPYSYVTSLAQTTVSKYATAKASILSGDYVKAFEEATNAGASFWYGVVDHIYDLDNIATDGTVQLRGGLKTIQVENMNRRYFGVYYLEGKKADNTVVRSYADYASTASGSTHQEKAGSNANSFAYVVSSLSTTNRNEWEVKNLTTFLKRSVEGALKASDSSEYNAKFSLEQFNAKGVNELVKAEIDDITYGDDYFTSKVYGALVKSDGSSDLKDITDKLDFNLQWAMNANSGVTLLSSPKQTINVQDVKGTDYTKATLTLGGNNLAVNFNVKPLTLSSSNSTAAVSDYQVSKLSEISSLNVQATVKVSPSGKRTSEKTYTFTPSISGSGLGEYTATVTGSGKFGGQISSLFNILGILNVDNISTYNGFYAKTSPTFPTSTDGITYSYDSSKLSVEGNKFTGKVNGTHTVTASIKNGVSKSFTVTVNDASGLNAKYVDNAYYMNKLNNNKTAFNSFECNDRQLTMFIGDSFFDTQFFSDFYTRFADCNAYTFGMSSSLARQWEWYVQKLYELNPQNVVIHIGTNDIFDDGKGKDEVVARLKRLFTNLHENLPNANVYWFSIEPRRGSNDGTGNGIATQVNSAIQSYLSNGYATYIDSYTFFNEHKTDAYYQDTVHPTVYGYNKLMECLYNSGHRFSNNDSFNGSLSLGSWGTSASDGFNASKTIYLARDKFLYKTTATINSVNGNGHITLNFNHSDDVRFLLWNKQSNGNLYYGGCPGYVISSNNYATAGRTLEIAVLKTDRHAYMFIDGSLQVVLYNAPVVNYFTAGSEGCVVSFANNKTYNSSSSEYNTYFSMVNNSTYENSSITARQITIVDSADSNATACADFRTDCGTDGWIVHNIPNIPDASKGKEEGFVLGFDFIIESYLANGHVTINFNGNGSTRFLIWNAGDNDGKFYFGGVNGESVRAVSMNFAQPNRTYHADILVGNTHAYLFINGALQTIYANKPTVTSVEVGTGACKAFFSYVTVKASTSGRYKTLLASVSSHESTSYSGVIDTLGDWTTTTSDGFDQSRNIMVGGKFLVTFNAIINSEDTSTSTAPHLTFNFNDSANTRFLLWDVNNNNQFYYVGAANGGYKFSSTNYATKGINIKISILVADNHAYMFINGILQAIYTNVPDITAYVTDDQTPNCSLTIGSEKCSVSFTDVKIYGSSTSNYTTKKNSVSSYENTNYTGQQIIDVFA